MTTFHTERLILRPFRHADWCRLQHYVSQEIVTRYDNAYPTSDAECQGICDWFSTEPGFWAVALAESDMLIGHIVSRPRETDEGMTWGLGFVFDPDYWGQSYAYEASRRILVHVVEELGAQKVIAGCAAANDRSWRLLERLGFEREAHHPNQGSPSEAARGETNVRGTYEYALTCGQAKVTPCS